MEWCRQHKDTGCTAYMNLVLSASYVELGQFDQAFEYVKKGYDQASGFASDDWLKVVQGFAAKIYVSKAQLFKFNINA